MPPHHLVVMGVSGSGKSTVGEALASALGHEFLDADTRHPPANIERMSAGIPLTDADREPWLADLAAWTRERHGAGVSTVLACSALRRAYRDVLRDGDLPTTFVHVTADPEVLLARMGRRRHFMPVDLLQSQLDTLEPLEPDEAGLDVDTTHPPAQIVEQVRRYLAEPA